VSTRVVGPLVQQHGHALAIMGINVSTEQGGALYLSTVESLDIPAERRVIPFIVIGETALIGSGEIADRLPGLVRDGLAAGGVDWPDLPGLEEIFVAVDATLTVQGAGKTPETDGTLDAPGGGTSPPTSEPVATRQPTQAPTDTPAPAPASAGGAGAWVYIIAGVALIVGAGWAVRALVLRR